MQPEGKRKKKKKADAFAFKRLIKKNEDKYDPENDSQAAENSLEQDLRAESVQLPERRIKGDLTKVYKDLMVTLGCRGHLGRKNRVETKAGQS